jgi:hypothetical protein
VKRKAVDSTIKGLLHGLPRDLVEANARKVAASRKPLVAIRRLLSQDYVRSLRRHLSYADVRTLVSAFERIFPGFNSRAIAMMSVRQLGTIAARLKFHLQAVPYDVDDGLVLRGFYVTRAEGVLKRPLVFVNTAHHPLAVATTFVHELAHHVATEYLSLGEEPIHFFFDADYAAHLGDPGELAADIMVSLAGYSAATARKIFPLSWKWGLVAKTGRLTNAALEEIREHLQTVYGFNLVDQVPADRRSNHLAGMIHYAKLRWALLAEYDI